MKILITGASGFIGGHLVEALRYQGYRIVACSRSRPATRDGVEWVPADLTADRSDDWSPRLVGVGLVINAAGVFQPTHPGELEGVHERGPRELFSACAQLGIRVIQISAIGAEVERPVTPFLATKQRADRFLLGSGAPAVVLYPGLVVGEGGQSTGLLAALAALPLIPLLGGKDRRLPLIHIDRLVARVLALVRGFPPGTGRIPLAEYHPIRDYLALLRLWLGRPPGRFFPVPLFPVQLLFRILPRLRIGLLDRDSLRMLLGTDRSIPGGSPTLAGDLQRRPPSAGYRRAVGLRFLPGIALASLVLLWCWTALCSVTEIEAGLALIREFGVSNEPVGLALILGGALLDALLGIALLPRRLRIPALGLQLLVIAGYTLLITLFMPAHWLHPFGPVSKNLPLAVLTLWLLIQTIHQDVRSRPSRPWGRGCGCPRPGAGPAGTDGLD